MSVREEERQKSCPSRGLGIAAAAIGVGVGAALYYFFSKRNENPGEAGSTTEWSYEEENRLNSSEECSAVTESDFEDSYTTVSVRTTSDTSLHDSTASYNSGSNVSDSSNVSDNSNVTDNSTVSHYSIESDNSNVTDNSTVSHYSIESDNSNVSQISTASDVSIETDLSNELNESDIFEGYSSEHDSVHENSNDSNIRASWFHCSQDSRDLDTINESDQEWDMPSSDLPTNRSPERVTFNIPAIFTSMYPRRRLNRKREAAIRIADEAFRQRNMTSEDCSICFETMNTSDEVFSLPCTHRFHQSCILPWLQEQQTCPMCRKSAW